MLTNLAGKTAVVLGGNAGIGRAAVLKLAACGASVMVQGRDAKAAEEWIAEAKSLPGKIAFTQTDLMSYEGVEAAFEAAKTQFGKIDILVASGGPREPKPALFKNMTVQDTMDMMSSRLNPRLFGIHAAVKYMRDQSYGKIVLITTDAGRIATPGESIIGSVGAMLIFMTRALASELADLGIRVNAVATTLTTGTPPYEAFLKAKERGSEEIIVKAFTKAAQRVKFRLNTAEDVAEYILYLCSPESDQVSGSTISINGGLSFPSY